MHDTDEQAGAHPLRSALRKALRTALKRAQAKHEKLLAELAECDRADYFLECGEIIKANLDAVKRGESAVTLPDMYNPGQTRQIELDVNLKPLDNAKKYFKKQRKLQAGGEKIAAQERICAQEIEALTNLADKYTVWEGENPPEVPPAPDFATLAGALRVHVPGLEPRKTPQERKNSCPAGVREFVSHDGLTIYVGKNARDNDNLSIRIARGNDWWFHVAHMQGSHVVVRNPVNRKGGDPLPQESLLDAAHLAAYFSKARRAATAQVHYAQAKNLHKAKGAPAGQVIVNNGQILQLRVEPQRLERLLKGNTESD